MKKIQEMIEQEIESRITENLTEVDTYKLYDEMLEEIYGQEINGINISYAEALKDQDPIAYRCGYADFLDSLRDNTELVEIEEKFYDEFEVQREKDELEQEIFYIIQGAFD